MGVGFLVMAYSGGGYSPLGTFSSVSDGQTLDCYEAVAVSSRSMIRWFLVVHNATVSFLIGQSAATHDDRGDKSSVSVTWTPPQDFTGAALFQTTFVQNVTTFWVKQSSQPIFVNAAETTETSPVTDPQTTPSVETSTATNPQTESSPATDPQTTPSVETSTATNPQTETSPATTPTTEGAAATPDGFVMMPVLSIVFYLSVRLML